MHKIAATLLILIFTGTSSFSQFNSFDLIPGNTSNYKPSYQSNYPEWGKMLYTENLNFNKLEEAYAQWDKSEEENFKALVRYYKLWKKTVAPFITPDGTISLEDVNTYQQNIYTQQLQHRTTTTTLRSGENEWTFLGPKETFWLNESGSSEEPEACPWQVNVYAFDVTKTDYNTIYAGTETGFINKTTDNGLNWQLMAQGYSFGGGVTAIAVHPQNENVVYASAGGQIHKTEDGGSNWTPLLAPVNSFSADKITISPLNANKIFAAGSDGIFSSNDAGITWVQKWSERSYDIHFKPNDENILYAISTNDGFFEIIISTDGGNSFHTDNNFPADIENASGGLIAVSPDAPDQLWAIMLSANNTPYFYKGNMNTGNWSLVATGDSDLFPMDNGQGFFDLVLEVSPLDSEEIFIGTTTLFKTTDGGSSFNVIGGYYGDFPIHPDIQCMQLLDNGTAWVSTDGGFTFSTDYFTSNQNNEARNNMLVGSSMWGFDQGWNEDIIVGGRYHNGNTAIADFYQPKALRMGGAESPTGWVMKGESRHVAFNDLGSGWILPETAEGEPQGRFIFSKYPNMDEYGGRRSNMFFHPNYYEVIYLGEGNGFWKSSDMGQSFELLNDFGNRVRFCQIAYNDPNIIYADIVNEGLYRSNDGGYTWHALPSLTSGIYGTAYWKGKLHFAISPNDANTIYACLQNGTWSADRGKVFKSTDGGFTWSDWSGTLDEFTKTLVIQPDDSGNDILYLFTTNASGNSGQCFVRTHDDNNWTTFGEAYPAGMWPIYAAPFYKNSKIRVAGNGGVWENNLAETHFQPIVQPWIERPFYDCMMDTIQLEDHSIVNHDRCTWSWSINPAPLYIDNANARNPKVVLGAVGSYDVTLSITKDGNTYSKTIENMMSTIECPSVENCSNPGLIAKSEWTLEYVDSEEINYPGYAIMAFDDDPSTIWHTRWSTGSDPYPHEIQIDLGEVYDVHEFTYLPRQVGQNGRINEYKLYFSEDINDWGALDTSGVFPNTTAPQKLAFNTPKVGRYLKLVATSEVNGNAWTSIAELDIKACYHEVVTTEDLSKHTKLKAFPVPTSGIFKVSLPADGLYEYQLYSSIGKLMEKGETSRYFDSMSIDLGPYLSGTYILRIQDQNGVLYFVKVVKG